MRKNWEIRIQRRIRRFLHWISRGKWMEHSLEGGWCPLCKSIYYYPGWKKG